MKDPKILITVPKLETLLETQGLKASPQALKAIQETISRTNWEYLGDSDSLLVGLLHSGSYTIDILESSGAKMGRLRREAQSSVRGMVPPPEDIDLADQFLDGLASNSSLLEEVRRRDGFLETADILRQAVSATFPDQRAYRDFPVHLRIGSSPSSPLERELEYQICDLIENLITFLDLAHVRYHLEERRHRVTEDEDHKLDVELGHSYRGMTVDELEFCIDVLNAWFLQRRILTDPPGLCVSAIKRMQDIPFGAQLISDARGNLKAIDYGLATANLLSPERDLATISLIERDGRIYVGQYTYRNTFLIDTRAQLGHPLRRVSIQAIRPVSLVAAAVIQEFENLLSKKDLSENEIQFFLTQHPGLLESLGYSAVHAHICLREEGSRELIPDFILEIPGSHRFDIIDLKLPSARLAARSPYLRASSDLMMAVAQLRKYANFFESVSNRKAFHRRYGLEPFKPQLGVVIGRADQLVTTEKV
jgi:hypothetical protein